MPYALSWMSAELHALAERQLGVVSRSQLRALSIGSGEVAACIGTERWTAFGERVVLMQNAPPSREQRRWIGVLHASDWTGETAALCADTGAEIDGLEGFESVAVHVLVRRGVHVPSLAGLRVHESRRFRPADIHPVRTPPRTWTARSVVDMASWRSRPRLACVVLAASVQQRVCRVEDLRETLLEAGSIRHRRLMAVVLDDIEGGAHSLPELDVARLCRRWNLALPRRQTRRRDATGRRRYLDCEWRTPDGRSVVLEVDGGQHMGIEQWWQDMPRERSVVLQGSIVLRCSSVELRLDDASIAADLRAAGVPIELSASVA